MSEARAEGGASDSPLARIVTGLLLVSALALGIWHAQFVQFFCDDSFISYRYSQNLADGHGLVYNVGERVEGYTNFLWVVAVGLGLMVGMSAETASLMLGILALLAVAGVVVALGRRITGSWAFGAAGAALLAAMGPVVLWSLSGLETGLYLALAMGAFFTYHSPENGIAAPRRLLLAGTLYAFASMTRPDGAVLGAVAGLHLIVTSILQRVSPGMLLARAGALAGGFFLWIAPFFLWRYSYYGDWLPNTFYVKTGSPVLWHQGVQYLRGFAGEYPSVWVTAILGMAACFCLPFLRSARTTLLHGVLLLVAYGFYVARAGGDYMALYRFIAPLLPLALLFSVVLAYAALHPTRTAPPWVRRTAVGVALAALVSMIVWSIQPSRHSVDGDVPTEILNDQKLMANNSDRWTKLGRELDERLWPDARLATTAAGAIAYYSKRYTLDQSGLCDSFTAREESDPWFLHKPGHKIQATRRHLLEQSPPIDVVISHPKLGPLTSGVLFEPPSKDYALRVLEIASLRSAAGEKTYLYCSVHRSRLEQARQAGFFDPLSGGR